MSATIDGTVWTALKVAAGIFPSPSNNGDFEINASDCVHFLSINVSNVNGSGTYPVYVDYRSDTYLAGPSWSIDAPGGNGSITVTALTGTALGGTISGSFAFTLTPNQGATGTKVITNGSFNIIIQ